MLMICRCIRLYDGAFLNVNICMFSLLRLMLCVILLMLEVAVNVLYLHLY